MKFRSQLLFRSVDNRAARVNLLMAFASCAALAACGGGGADKAGNDQDSTTEGGTPTSSADTSSTSTTGQAQATSTGSTTSGSTTGFGSANAANGTGGAGSSTSSTSESGATPSSTSGGIMPGSCGNMQVSLDPNPFGCELAWGANGNNGNRSSYLDFITTWVGYEPNGGLNGQCDGCGLVRDLANTNAIPVYYAYLIGYMTSEDGYGDCNTDFDGENLCTHGAQWIRENRDRLIDAYVNYAQMTYDANPNKPVVWLLEGDFIQYTYEDQSQAFSVQELSQLAVDITCAIKSNAPNAVVAVNHSAWISDELTDQYWTSLPLDLIDMIWTTGVGNNDGFLNSDAGPNSYNGATAKYEYLHNLTGKGILVDTSFGASQQNDSWSGESASVLDDRISEGVIAVNVTQPPGDYQSRIGDLSLASTCN